MISQLPGGGLVTLDSRHPGSGSILFLLEETLTLHMGLLSLHTMLLSKLPSVNLQNPVSTHHGSVVSDGGISQQKNQSVAVDLYL